MLGTAGGGTVMFLSCELNSGAWPSGAVVGRCAPSPNIDLDRPLVVVVVLVLVLETVLLWLSGDPWLDDLALLVVDAGAFVLDCPLRDLLPRSLLDVFVLAAPIPGNGGKAQS